MTREIKFRAWDTVRKVMVGSDYEDNWEDDKDEWYADTALMNLVGIEEINEDNRYHVMQYTGLKDKNGKKIYEGDILEYEEFNIDGTRYPNNTKSDVIFSCGSFTLCGQPISKLDFPSLWKVIGNIYENPELMKE